MHFPAGIAAVFRRKKLAVRVGVIAIGLAGVIAAGPAVAQTATAQLLQSLSPDQLQQLQQRMGGSAGGASGSQAPSNIPTVIKPVPATPQTSSAPPSRLERLMSARAGVQLKQFGYDQLGIGQSVTVPQIGAVQDNYVLGPGDEIDVTLRGQENAEYRVFVDRNGQVIIPKLAPISAAGRTLGALRRDLEDAINRAYVSTQGYVTIGQLRQVSVLVSGEVSNPGTRVLTGLSSPLDAILLSGGIKKAGSLRNVKLIRDGHTRTIDLYDVITQGGSGQQINLMDGDRIVVPTLGPTVAISGWVRRPAIYELPQGTTGISAGRLIALAGGTEVRGKYRISLLRLDREGQSKLVSANKATTVHDSDVLSVQPAATQTTSKATLSGGMAMAGRFAVGHNTMLSDLIKAPGALGEAPYTLIGLISRRDPKTYLRELVAFSPVAVLNGNADMALRSDDIVRVISVGENRMIRKVMTLYDQHQTKQEEAARNPEATVGSVANIFNAQGGLVAAPTSSSALSGNSSASASNSSDSMAQAALSAAQASAQPDTATETVVQNLSNRKLGQNIAGAATPEPSQNLETEVTPAGGVATNKEVTTFGQLASQLGVSPTVLANFLSDRTVQIDGAVRGPGSYLVGPGVSLQDVVQAAGGTVDWADESGVELTTTTVDRQTGKAKTRRISLPLHKGMLANYIVQPHDEIRFRKVFTNVDIGSVTMQGQVRFPGSYQVSRGEHLSDLLLRAGGLTDVAFPYGTVFLRRSAAAVEATGYKRTADEINNQLLIAMTRNSDKAMSPNTFAALQGFVKQLRETKPLGRISVTADPSVLLAHPASDVLLEPGDVIYIPQRPSTIAVLGRVLQPGSFPFRPDMSVEDYIDQAGGYAQFADESETFVILPDGTARRVESSWLNFDQPNIPPGSAVVVPRDLSPLDVHQLIVDATSIMGQLAVSAASLAVLAKQ